MFIVGNGFDFDEVMREMPHVGCISKYGIEYYTEHKLFSHVCGNQTTEQTKHREPLLYSKSINFVSLRGFAAIIASKSGGCASTTLNSSPTSAYNRSDSLSQYYKEGV